MFDFTFFSKFQRATSTPRCSCTRGRRPACWRRWALPLRNRSPCASNSTKAPTGSSWRDAVTGRISAHSTPIDLCRWPIGCGRVPDLCAPGAPKRYADQGHNDLPIWSERSIFWLEIMVYADQRIWPGMIASFMILMEYIWSGFWTNRYDLDTQRQWDPIGADLVEWIIKF